MSWLKKSVLVPFDFSDAAKSAVETALQIVAAPADVTVVYVLQELSAVEPSEVWRTIDDPSRIEHSEKALREVLSQIGHPDVRTKILIGDPGHEIAELAQEQKVELIVMPSHGRTGFKRLLIGSVAERVVRLAHCPVLVLRS